MYEIVSGNGLRAWEQADARRPEPLDEPEDFYWASGKLKDYLGDDWQSGWAILFDSESEVGGEHCVVLAVGANDAGKFTAERRCAVTDSGETHELGSPEA